MPKTRLSTCPSLSYKVLPHADSQRVSLDLRVSVLYNGTVVSYLNKQSIP
jgi:hypothetical protein